MSCWLKGISIPAALNSFMMATRMSDWTLAARDTSATKNHRKKSSELAPKLSKIGARRRLGQHLRVGIRARNEDVDHLLGIG